MSWHSFISCKNDHACDYLCFTILNWMIMFFFQMTKQMHFLKKWCYEMVTSKVLFLTAHEMFLRKLLCMLEDFKLHLDKNCLNYLSWIHVMACFYFMRNWLCSWLFMFCHFKLTDHIFSIQMTKQFHFLKIMLFHNGHR